MARKAPVKRRRGFPLARYLRFFAREFRRLAEARLWVPIAASVTTP